MPVRWDSREEGITDLEAFFDYAGYKARDLREPLSKSRDHVIGMMIDQFATEGARGGGWDPLEEHYAEWKATKDPHSPLLQLAPELIRGGTPRDHKIITALTDIDAWVVTREYALFEPDATRADWHQEGEDRSRGGVLPARPPLVFLEEDYDEIEGFFADWMDELRTANIRRGAVDAAIRPGVFG